ncbi:ABC transporter substrate-binding protein [Roseitranquillus sediminis]|uniref:ABC transporter substrate-binding protein n=1 Tax=Roseitranquillus sediminis TaxID=2809051 RepID=UPI001D0C739E|nr:ABC transporter substrate-binding protein [Roseitranquillus sediminis]MBM9595954.1 ABC transporter substrate-binding protein [Roseitranquillus sediminis]
MTNRWIGPLAAAAALWSAMAAAQEGDAFRLIVTDLEAPLVPNSVMELALNLGYYEREGVNVELVRVQQTPSALAALTAGEGEMANISVDALLQMSARGNGDLRAVVSPNKSLPFLIAAKEDIASTADLEGRSFGIGRIGSLDHSLSSLVLSGDGLVMDDQLELVGLGQPAARAQALAAGQIDATTMSIGVWTSLPDKTGLHILVPQDAYYEAAPVVSKVNVVTTDTLENRREDVEAVIAAIIQISRDVAEDPSIWVDAMAEARPDVDRATLEELAESFEGSWSVNGGMSASELQYTAEWLFESEDFADLSEVELSTWTDFGPVDAVLEQRGIAEGSDQPAR